MRTFLLSFKEINISTFSRMAADSDDNDVGGLVFGAGAGEVGDLTKFPEVTLELQRLRGTIRHRGC